jgi:hypothetical protein
LRERLSRLESAVEGHDAIARAIEALGSEPRGAPTGFPALGEI